MRQVADDETVGDAAVLVNHEEVRHVVSAARVHQLAELVAAAVQPLRAREDEAHFLQIKIQLLYLCLLLRTHQGKADPDPIRNVLETQIQQRSKNGAQTNCSRLSLGEGLQALLT